MKNQNDELKKKVESISFVGNNSEDLLLSKENKESDGINVSE